MIDVSSEASALALIAWASLRRARHLCFVAAGRTGAKVSPFDQPYSDSKVVSRSISTEQT